jgi:hypothetical protein
VIIPSFHERVVDAIDTFMLEHDASISDMEKHKMKFELVVRATRDDIGINFSFTLASENVNHAKQ